jgi:hypothetical protein
MGVSRILIEGWDLGTHQELFREVFRLYKTELEERYAHAKEEGYEDLVKNARAIGRYDPAEDNDISYIHRAIESIKQGNEGIYSTLERFSGFATDVGEHMRGIIVIDLNGLLTFENQNIFGQLSDRMHRSYGKSPWNLRVSCVYEKHPSLLDSAPIVLETDGKETHITLDRDKANEHMENPLAFYLSQDPETGDIIPVIPGRVQIEPKDDLKEYFKITMDETVGPELEI